MIIVPQHHSTTTARSRALAERLRATIADFQAREPKLTSDEIAMALREAQLPVATAAPRRTIALVAVLAGIAMAIGIGLVADRAKQADTAMPAMPIIAIVVAALAAVLAVVIKLRNDG